MQFTERRKEWHFTKLASIAGATSTPESDATATSKNKRPAAVKEVVVLQESTLRQQAEKYLGEAISPEEWECAKRYAERKLAMIIEREGDADGARRESWYLAQLIAETVRSNRFSKFTFDLGNFLRYVDEKIGIKKEQPVSMTRTALNQ